jgi:hypothetical protein
MPLRIFNSLSIYCLANGVTKSLIMEQAFAEWFSKHLQPSAENECFVKIAENIHNRYLDLKLSKRSLTYSIFVEDMKKELELKAMPYTSIQAIFKEFDIIHFNK